MKTLLQALVGLTAVAAVAVPIVATPTFASTAAKATAGTDLGTLPGHTFGQATGITNKGLVLGTSGKPGGGSAYVSWTAGKATAYEAGVTVKAVNSRGQYAGHRPGAEQDTSKAVLGEPGGKTVELAPNVYSSSVYALNERGEVLVNYQLGQREPVRTALWQNGQLRELTNESQGNALSGVLNDNGIAVVETGANSTSNVYRCDSAACAALPKPATHASKGIQLGGINAGGQIVGTFVDGDGENLAGSPAIWTGTTVSLLTTPGDKAALGMRINDRGEVIGRTTKGDVRALRWRDGKATEIGPVGAIPQDINASGDVVLAVQGTRSGPRTAALWRNGAAIDLKPTGGFANARPAAVNDDGVVVGMSWPGGSLTPPAGQEYRPTQWTTR